MLRENVCIVIDQVIGGVAYEARRLVPPQNLGSGSVPPHYFCRQML